jgi:hypothetical protein
MTAHKAHVPKARALLNPHRFVYNRAVGESRVRFTL